MKKKILKARTKIMAAAVVMISFAAVLVWHQMINAQEEYPHKSRTYQNGYAKFFVNNSSWMEVQFQCSGLGDNVNQATFKKQRRYVSMSVKSGGGGYYDLKLESNGGYTYEKSKNEFVLLDVKMSYKIPAHCQLDKQTKDAAFEFEDIQTTGNTGHETGEHTVYKTFKVSAYSIGLSTYDDNIRHFNGSINFDISKPWRSVRYNGNGGDGADTTWGFTDGDKFTFPTVSRRGYTLAGWLDEESGWMADTGWLVCGDYTETAQWTANTYMVSYDGNGEDSGWVSEETATYDQNFTFSKNAYTKKGYSFVGWNKDKNATTAEYSPGTTITWNHTDDMKLYAVWSKSSYEVTFDGNGASAGKKTADLKYGQDAKLPANTFERPGYTFIGWSEDPDAVRPKYTDGQTVYTLCDAGKTYELYAVWKKTDGSFDTHNIIRDDGMFNGSVELEGQNGTGFSRDHVDSEYGRIDKDGQPGYFTDRYR